MSCTLYVSRFSSRSMFGFYRNSVNNRSDPSNLVLDCCKAFLNELIKEHLNDSLPIHEFVSRWSRSDFSSPKFRSRVMKILCELGRDMSELLPRSQERCAKLACAIIGIFEGAEQLCPSASDDLLFTFELIVSLFSSTLVNNDIPLAVVVGLRFVCHSLHAQKFCFSWIPLIAVLLNNHQLFSPLPFKSQKEHARSNARQSFITHCSSLIEQTYLSVDATTAVTTRKQHDAGVQAIAAAFRFAPCALCFVELLEKYPRLHKDVAALESSVFFVLSLLRLTGRDNQLEHVKTLTLKVPALGAINIATALLGNNTLINARFSSKNAVQLLHDLLLGHDASGEKLFSFVNAVKLWLRSNVIAEALGEENPRKKARINPFASTKPKTQVEKTLDKLQAAAALWEDILRFPVLIHDEHSASICAELTQSYFLRDTAPVVVVEAILRFCACEPESAVEHRRSGNVLRQHLEDFCGQLVTESAVDDAMEFVEAILRCDALKQAHLDILQVIARKSGVECEQVPNSAHVMSFLPFWGRLVRHFDPRFPDHPFGYLLAKVKAVMLNLIAHACCGSCTLSDLGKVIRSRDNLEQFVSISWLQGAIGNENWEKMLRKREAEWDSFVHKRNAVKCYVALYCKSEHIETDTLENDIQRFYKNDDELTLEYVNREFKSGQWVELMYNARGSEVFMSMWKQGADLLRKCVHNIHWEHHDGMKEKITCTLCAETHFESLPDFYQHLQAHHDDALDLRVTSFDNLILSQHVATTVLVPHVVQQWFRWYRILSDGTATVHEISTCFGHTDLEKELQVLHHSCYQHGSEGLAWNGEKVKERMKLAREAEHVKMSLQALVELRLNVALLFSAVHDPFVEGITQKAESISADDRLQLKDVDAAFVKVVDIWNTFPFVKNISAVQRLYISMLSQCTTVIEWLLTKPSTEDFNKMISLVRPSTDDPRVLQALAALVQLRTALSKVLYEHLNAQTYRDVKHFMTIFTAKMPSLSETDVRYLDTVQNSFDVLMMLVNRKAQSSAAKAVDDVRDIMLNGKYVLKVGVMESEQLTVFNHSDTTNSLNYEQLSDLRKQVLMTEVPEELEDVATLKRWMAQFIVHIELLLKIKEVLQQLNDVGHFDYFCGMKLEFFPLEVQKEKLDQIVVDCEEKLDAWIEAIDNLREKFYFLNFFTVAEMRFLISNLRRACHTVHVFKDEPNMDSESLWSTTQSETEDHQLKDVFIAVLPMLKLIGQTNLESLKKVLNDSEIHWGPRSTALDSVRALGLMLDNLYRQQVPQIRPFTAPSALTVSFQEVPFVRAAGSDGVFVCTVEEDMIDFILSIYIRRDRLPEHEEVLFCSAETPLEEVLLLVQRYARANDYARGERVFVCANIELLSYVTQCKVVERLRRLLDAANESRGATLVFASAKNHQMILRAFENKKISVSPFPKAYLQRCIDLIAKNDAGDHVLLAVSSLINGAGKSHFIMERAYQLRQESSCAYKYRRVLIRENATAASLVRDLNDNACFKGQNGFVHLDIGPVCPNHLSALLFQALIIGTLRDSAGHIVGQCFHKRDGDHFVLELPLVARDEVLDDGVGVGVQSIASLLPLKEVAVNADALKFTTPVLQDNGVVTRHHNHRLVLTCKYLRAMTSGAFCPQNRAFNPSWTPCNDGHDGQISEEECFELLRAHAGMDGDPNFLVFTNFTTFMGAQFERMDSYPLLQMETLTNLGDGWPYFKQVFSDLLLRTSTDFSLRQVPRIQGTQKQSQLARFASMLSWEQSSHPMCVFFTEERTDTSTRSRMDVSGVEIVSLDSQLVDRCMNAELRQTLEHNCMRLQKSWNTVNHDEAVTLIRQVEGVPLTTPASANFALTVDALLKGLSIQLRLKYGLPVLLMGETGCGKTALFRFICDALQFSARTMDIHGGISDDDIITFVERCCQEADEMKDGCLVCFLDEINTANCMALFKALICDRVLPTRTLPSNLRIAAACNPYRSRQNEEDETAALVYQFAQTTRTDPLGKLVYRVHPLPESLIDCVQDFGALSEQSEKLYIQAILGRELPKMSFVVESWVCKAWVYQDGRFRWKPKVSDYEGFIEAFKEVICAAHAFLREINRGERSVVSLRDVGRTCKVFKWFLRYYTQLKGCQIGLSNNEPAPSTGVMEITEKMRPHLRSAIILSLSYTYHARLSHEHRSLFRERICSVWSDLSQKDERLEWLSIASPAEFERVTINTQTEFVAKMKLGEGVALNEALRENLFMLLVSVMNQIPIFLVGKPGSSKSLALELLQSNFNGEVSEQPFLQLFPAIEVFPFQCTPLTKAEGISSAFTSARRYCEGQASNILVLVLLDEVGLADLSPHMPLKVLHKELDNLQGVACVGISNWALDAAKMNRAVHLYRPPPTVEDLCATAEGMVRSTHLCGYLVSLAEAFSEVYRSQRRADFWGLREFYSTVRVINAALQRAETVAASAPTLEADVLMAAVARNYGGRPDDETEIAIKTFFRWCGLNPDTVQRYDSETLVKQNLLDPDARHLMLLTHHNAALSLLFERRVVRHDTTEVMFGSSYRADSTELSVTTDLMRVKQLMTKPIALILVNCDALYESLYDLLNQHYLEYSGQRYVRLAYGAQSQLCPIHQSFRIIVIVSPLQAYTRLAPPLLNRFEKQCFSRRHFLNAEQKRVILRLQKFVRSLQRDIGRHSVFACDHPELLVSLVAAEPFGPRWFERCVAHLCRILRPEAMCLLRAVPQASRTCTYERLGVDVLTIYESERPPHFRRSPSSFIIEELLPSAKNISVVKSADAHQGSEEAESMADGFVQLGLPPAASDVGLDPFKLRQRHNGTSAGSEEVEWKNIPGTDHESYSEYGSKSAESDGDSVKGGDASTLCEKFGKLRLDTLGSQILVMTHSPLRGTLAESISESLHSNSARLSSVLLHELSTLTDLEQRLTSFYAEANCGQSKILLLQADLRIASIEQIEHCRFLCDKTRQRKINETSDDADPYYVVFYIHFACGSKNREFPVGYDKRWKLFFLDTIEPAVANLPTLEEMMNASIAQTLASSLVNFGELLQLVARQSLAQLSYPKRRTLDDATRQIRLLLDLAKGEPEFVNVLYRHVCKIMEASESTSCNDWCVNIARKPRTVTLAGSFRNALHKRMLEVVSAALSALLTQLDRNDNLRLIKQEGFFDLWLRLATCALNQPYVLFLGQAAIDAGVRSQLETFTFNVGCDAAAYDHHFKAQFPFSFFVAKKIEGLRELAHGSISSLEQQFHMTGLNISVRRKEEEIARYATDFLSMYLPDGLPPDTNINQVWRLMKAVVPAEYHDCILAVHVTYWKIGSRLRTYFSLLKLVDRGAHVLDSVASLDGQYDADVIDHCCQRLIAELRTRRRPDNWLARSRKALLHVQDLRFWLEKEEVVTSDEHGNCAARQSDAHVPASASECRDSVVRLELLVKAADLCPSVSVETYLPEDVFSFDADVFPIDIPMRHELLETWIHVIMKCQKSLPHSICAKIAEEVSKAGYAKVARLSVLRALMLQRYGYDALEASMIDESPTRTLLVTVFEELTEWVPPSKETYPRVHAAYQRAALHIKLRRYADTLDGVVGELWKDDASRYLVVARWLRFQGQAGLHQIVQERDLPWLHASKPFLCAALGGPLITWDALHDIPAYHEARHNVRDGEAAAVQRDILVNTFCFSACFTELHVPRASGIVIPHALEKQCLSNEDQLSRLVALASGFSDWHLSNNAPMDCIFMTRCLFHLLSIALHGQGVLTVFRQILRDPNALLQCWLPAMDQDPRLVLGNAMGDAALGWYCCPNGHPYYIGECGKPVTTLNCPECNAQIGGEKYILSANNTQLAVGVDISPTGYCLPDAHDTEKMLDLRNLPDIVARALRWCVNGLMFAGSKTGVNYSCIMHGPHTATTATLEAQHAFFEKHLVRDWGILKERFYNGENAAIYLHEVFRRLAANAAASNAPTLSSAAGRADWENEAVRLGFNVLVDPIVTPDELRTRFLVESAENPVFDEFSADSLADDDFAFREDIAAISPLNDLKNVNLHDHALLRRLILHYPQPLSAVKYLRDCIHWVTFVHATYSRKIDRERGRQMTIRDALKAAGPEDKMAFLGFQAAWALAWPSVTHYECLEVPAEYKEVEVTDAHALSFCMPDEKDECVCCLAFLQFLVNLHNEVLDDVDVPGSDQVPTHMLSFGHIIDLENIDVKRVLVEQCLTYRSGTREYELSRAKNAFRHALSAKPRVRLEIPQFVFLKEGGAVRLHHIRQCDIAADVCDKLAEELTHDAAVASACLDTVEMALHFLRAQGDVHMDDSAEVGRMPLKEYMNTVLLVPHTDNCPIATTDRIRLEHLEHLWRLLKRICADPQEALVRSKYREAPPENLGETLEDALAHVDLQVLDELLSNLISQFLTEDTLKANESLKVVMGMLPGRDVSQLSWWKHFPEELQLAHAAHVKERVAIRKEECGDT